jgi:hypothetical protein
VLVEEYKTNLMSLAILFHFLCAQHISDINLSIIRSLRLFCNTDTTPTQPHRNSNTHRTKNNTTNVVIQQNSRKLLTMDILMSETCWAHKKWNKIASDIKLVFYSSSSTMMHGPINIRYRCACLRILRILPCVEKNTESLWIKHSVIRLVKTEA